MVRGMSSSQSRLQLLREGLALFLGNETEVLNAVLVAVGARGGAVFHGLGSRRQAFLGWARRRLGVRALAAAEPVLCGPSCSPADAALIEAHPRGARGNGPAERRALDAAYARVLGYGRSAASALPCHERAAYLVSVGFRLVSGEDGYLFSICSTVRQLPVTLAAAGRACAASGRALGSELVTFRVVAEPWRHSA